jgi:hypothetical protein
VGRRSGRGPVGPLLLVVAVGCAARPSATPLAADAESSSEARHSDRKARDPSSPEASPSAEPAPEEAAPEKVTEAPAGPSATPPSAPASFHVLAKGQTLTRRLLLTLSFDVSVEDEGERSSVHVNGHGDQEVRFLVLSTDGGVASELELSYVRDHMTMEAMGQREEEPQPTYGNRYVAVLKGKSVEVRAAGGKSLSKEELDTARTDARELFTMQAAMAAAGANARGMTAKPTSALPDELLRTLAADDEQVKITNRKGTFRRFERLPSGETNALADVGFDVAFADDELTLSGSLTGSATLGTSPRRALELRVDGPVTLGGKDAENGLAMTGGGRIRMDVKYVY